MRCCPFAAAFFPAAVASTAVVCAPGAEALTAAVLLGCGLLSCLGCWGFWPLPVLGAAALAVI